jgi:putative nucleotidyltransferase with HDIG domain
MSARALTEADRLRLSFARRQQRMPVTELRAEALVAAAFLAAAIALAVFAHGERHLSFGVAALYVGCLAIAGHVRFDIGAGFTVPTQAVFVPMLFALPVSVVPLLVALALAIGLAPAVLSGRVPPSRLIAALGNSWFSVGPAAVLLLASDHLPYGRWGILLLALAGQFTCDFLASAARERLLGGLTVRQLLEETRHVHAIDLALTPLGLALAFATVGSHRVWAVVLVGPLFAVLRVFSHERRARLEQLIELSDAYQGTALLLGDVLEADDAYTGAHTRSVVGLAVEVARELGLDAERQRNVEFGALLHDVGKIAVPKAIINKPGELNDREWSIIRTHTIEGQRMLERIGGRMRDVGFIVRSSHERWDGGGYPDGLSADAIPLEARIVAACDAFNAMTTTRPYRRALSAELARAELRANAGTQFDPEVVRALLNVVTPDLGGRPGRRPARRAAVQRAPKRGTALRREPSSFT